MVQTPKYDNDTVNLGYLNKRLGETEESINNNNNSIAQIPKNYSTPPNPPYYKDSLLCYENKIYRCNITKLKGIFSWNDWSIVATDDSTVSDFINNTYEVEKLEIQEQIDGKIQTYYQENDPAIDWKTDLEKSKHIGDYWYNTNDNTQWRYNRITTTTPITYAWGQVNVPKAIFDAIDTKKSIYTAKPTSYKKDDLWIIEESISDNDLPIGIDENPIAKGDWVFSIADSDVYNKEHWVKRDEDVSLSYLEQHYYTIGDINTSFEEIERNTDSKITKAKDEINLNVSQTYTTKTEHTAAVNDFNEQIGTVNQTITEHKETISNLSAEVGEVSASVESVQTRTEEISSNVDGIIKEINPTSTASGSSIIIEDASDNSLTYLEIEGKSTQETRSGKNIFKTTSNIWASGTPIYNKIDDTFTFHRDSGVDYLIPFGGLNLKPNTDYVMYLDIIENTMTSAFSLVNSSLLTGNLIINAGEVGTKTIELKTQEEATTYDLWFYCASNGYLKTKIMLVEGTTVTEYEQYGTMPSPDYPSEIESVGYENLFDINATHTNGNATSVISGNVLKIVTSGAYGRTDYTNIQLPNNTYTISFDWESDTSLSETDARIYIYDGATVETLLTYSNLVGVSGKASLTFTNTTGAISIRFSPNNTATAKIITIIFSKIQIEKGTKVHSYIPNGKYGIEVETVGKNKYNKDLYVGSITEGYVLNELEIGKAYTISVNNNPNNTTYGFLIKPTTGVAMTSDMWEGYSKTFVTFTYTQAMRDNGYKLYITSLPSYNVISKEELDSIDLQLEEGFVVTEFQPYEKNSLLLILDQPLRSLPNEVKDIAYIKNNKLYVDRNIGSIVLDDSEEWGVTTGLHDGYMRFSYNAPLIKGQNRALSNYFKIASTTSTSVDNILEYRDTNVIYINTNVATNLNEFKTWLSTHNIEVVYELETPVIEELGEVEILKTLKGYNNISTTDKLLPVINLTYVRDTIIANYVENHVTELKLNEEQIRQSVETINSSVDGLSTDISRVEQITSDNSQILNIISTNIDKKTGDVREVTTTTGFTFNANGMTIQDSEGYQASHSTKGTVYKDGDTITGQYTKDGSKQKDLELFGTYSYGKETIDDTPMFVGELYTDENGEECFGHFYNGGDY